MQSVEVIEFLEPVIDWHHRLLVPASAALINDARCQLIHDDFFAHVSRPAPPVDERYDVVLVDIDHAPDAVLDAHHAAFYSRAKLERLVGHLRPSAIFGLWSAERPGEAVTEPSPSSRSRDE